MVKALTNKALQLLLFTLILSFTAWGDCPGVNTQLSPDQSFFCGSGPFTVNFTNNTTGTLGPNTFFEWYQNGTLSQTTTDINTIFSPSISTGIYEFMLVTIDPDAGCSDTATVSIEAVPAPSSSFTFTPNNGCAFQDVTFNNTSSGTYSGSNYTWDFGPGPNSTLENPTYSFNGPGSYNVSLTVNNGPGCQSSTTNTVNVIDAPVAIINADDGDGDAVYCLFPGDNTTAETVTFSNFSTGATSYEWDFGDGSPPVTTASLADITHDYSTYGTFTVTMTATGPNGCQTTTSTEVVFEKFVSAALTLDLTEYSGCTPHSMTTLTNLSVNASNYVWDFGDGSVFTETTSTPPSYAYSAAGSYTITLTASNSCNTAIATIAPIIIIDGPTANFSPSISNGCAPQTVSFFNSSSDVQPANNYQWDMGNGNTYVNLANPPNQIYPTTGSYDIELIAGNACGYDTIVQTIIIDTIPIVDLVLDPITGCTPLIVDPTATLLTGNNVSWQWYIDGVYTYTTPYDIPDQTFLSTNPNDSTLHTIRVVVSNACGSDQETDSVYVHPPVIANFTTQDTLCIGDLSSFTNISTGTELSFSWDFGDGSSLLTDTNTVHTYASAGDYTVTLTVTGHCGVDIYTFPVVIVDYPVVDFTPSNLAICEGESITIQNNSTTDGFYSWDFGANATPLSSTLFDPGIITFNSNGTQTISFTINYAGCISSLSTDINVNPIPVPAFSLTPNNGCTPVDVDIENLTVDSPGYTYNWDYGNGTTSTGYTPTDQSYITLSNDSTYSVQLIVESGSGCSDTLIQTVIVHPLPIAIIDVLDDTLCLGEAMIFANNSIGASSYSWDFGDGNTSTTPSPAYTYTGTGLFDVEMIAFSGSSCTDTANISIFIDSVPVPLFTNTTECLGGITVFIDASTGSPVYYEWDFGDGSSIDNSVNPSHLYSSAGSYLVNLTVTNIVNCSATVSQIVQVNEVPIADFGWSQTCLGSDMSFTDQTLNSPISWEWDFGDGNTSTLQNPSHNYVDTGSYTVNLVVSGGSGCLDSIEMNVYVDSIPTADFTYTSVCTNDTTLFIDNSSINPETYSWDFGDGSTSSLISPQHIYNTSGNYPVTLTVTYNSNGCSNFLVQNVEAFPLPTNAFTANTPCLGDTTNFIDQTGNNPISWEWDFGDGSPLSNDQNPAHLYNSGGFYDISLITVNNYNCSDTLQQQIQIYGLPTSDFSFNAVCLGSNTQFTNNSIDDVSWQWSFGDGSSDLNENPIHVYNSSGSFDVSLVVFNTAGCSDTSIQSVTVYPNPTAGFYADTACFSFITSFTDTSLDAVSWQYDLGDGTNSTNSNPQTLYSAPGTYTVQQLVTNVFGCQDSTEVDILILPQPEAGFTNTSVCAQDVVQYTDTTDGPVSFWEWDFGDGSALSNDQDPLHIYDLGGIYNVTLVVGNPSGCLDTTIVPIEVYTNPTALFEADTVCYLDVTNFTDLSSDAVPIVSWHYDFGDNINQSISQNPTYIYQAAGTYPVTLTIENIHGCDSSFTLDVIVNNIPDAEFTYDTVCWGSPTNFQDLSTGTVNSYYWDFGDGNTSTSGPNVIHTYPQPGSYLVSMEVDGGVGCTDVMYHAVQVLDVLTPQIGAPNEACVFELVQFQDLSSVNNGVITSWQWDFGDGGTSNLQNPTHSYSQPGNYVVTLDVQTNSGCTNSGTFIIQINDQPIADFDFTIPCEGQPTVFSDLSSDPNGLITGWFWNFGDGSAPSSDPNPTHLYGNAGTYNVTLTVFSSTGCSNFITQPVEIYPAPTASFNYGLECGGEPIDMVSTSVGNIQDYEWIYDGNTIGTSQTATHTFPTDTDTHPVTLVVTTDLGCIDSVTQNVVTRSVVFFDYGPLQTSGCPVMEVNFFENSTTSSSSTIINWLWDMGDGTYSFAQNPTHFYEDEGTYNISLQVTTSDDCVYYDTLAYSVIVYPQPTAGFTYAPDSINIMFAEVEFTNTSLGAQDVEWNFGDFDYSNDWDPVHVYADTGFYTVTQYVYNEFGCSDTAYQILRVEGNFWIYAPNTFTPDGNEHNQLFKVETYGIETYALDIYDRWGNLIYTVTKSDLGWDGTYKGINCQDGVYIWKLRAIDYDEIPHQMTGHVTLLR